MKVASALGLLVFGLLVYAAALLAQLPAAVAWQWLAAPNGQIAGVTVADLRGTVWSGSASGLRYRGLTLDRVSWVWRSGDLLGARLGVDWRLSGERLNGQGAVALGPAGVRLTDTRLLLDSAAIRELVPRARLVALGGELALDLLRLEADRGLAFDAAEGELRWLDAAAGVPDAYPLGDLLATLGTTPEGALRLALRDQGGPLILDGDLDWAPDGGLRVSAEAGVRPDAPPQILNGLQNFGQPLAGGRYRLTFPAR